ncbi:MAG: ATP-binding protein [Rubrivivax sp.]
MGGAVLVAVLGWSGGPAAVVALGGLALASLLALAWALQRMVLARGAVQRMSGIVAEVATPVMLLDCQGHTLWLNEAARRALDRPLADCLHRPAADLLMPEGEDAGGGPGAALRDALAHSQPFQGEVACRSTRGERFWWAVDLRLVRGSDGQFSGMLLMGNDVTERLHATWQLQRVLDGTRAGTWEMNVQTQAARVNAKWREMLGYPADQAGLETVAGVGALIHPDDGPTAVQILAEHLRGERPYFEVEQRLRHRDGHWVWMLSRGMVVTRDRLGAPEWLAGTHLDISERVAHAEELQRAKMAAEEANLAKSAFLATMSHEIRTPMNGIIGLAEILSHERLPEEQADAVNTIVSSGRALLAIIDDILDFSKIEAGRVGLEHLALPLRPLAEGVCDPLAAQYANQAVTLRLYVSPALPVALWGDPTRLRQVLFNLVGNALKFCRVPGRRGEVVVRLAPADTGHWQIEVADNGIGMSPATLASLFTAFTQAEASTTRRFGGTGLGLAITHRLVGLMNGDIQVHSTLGEGSTFTLRLPLEPADNEAGGPAVPDLSGVHCVTCCGSADHHAAMAAYLRLSGAQVQAADDLADAARRAAGLPGPVVVVHDSADLPAPSVLE